MFDNKGKYLSFEDISDGKLLVYDEVTDLQEIVELTNKEAFDKVNDLIKKVLQ